MKIENLFDDGQHRWFVMGRDPEKKDSVIDTNEYLIVSNEDGLLMDPGGTEVFPAVFRSVAQVLKLENLQTFVASHQDPDVFSSMPLWLGLCPQAKVHLPWLWKGFCAHFGYEFENNLVSVPDEGGPLRIGQRGREVQLIPAHFCHSPGNFSVYDPTARILFSGDIGAALLPPDRQGLFVEDFESHVRFMRGFHVRWMPSNEAKNAWIERVRRLDVDMLCPQHGAIFRGRDQVEKFLNWFEDLRVGQTNGDLVAR